jgi:hypothetical protein
MDDWSEVWTQRARRQAEQWAGVVAPRHPHARRAKGNVLTPEGEAAVNAAVARAWERREMEEAGTAIDAEARIRNFIDKTLGEGA